MGEKTALPLKKRPESFIHVAHDVKVPILRKKRERGAGA
jgi:hypothetical protein